MTAPEQVADKREQLMNQLAEEVEALKTSEGWRRWMQTASRFHRYSLRNQLLIAMQRPDATRVAGFTTWKSRGRSVREGEKGIAILAPTVRKVTEEASEPKGDGDESIKKVLTGFRVAHVFDVSQTNGEELPELAWPVLDMDGCDETLRLLVGAATAAGFAVEFVDDHDRGSSRGWYRSDNRSITVVDTYPAADKCATLVHEVAHGLDPRCNGDLTSTRAERELLAESVAYIVGTRLGLPVNEAATRYVASWGADTGSLDKIAGDALSIATQLDDLMDRVAQPLSA